MESVTPSSSVPPYSVGAGAGGKFRKPPVSRKRPSTPYDRPALTTPNNKSDESQDGGGGWLSKLLVNPARRLIVGGATRILPSFFAKADPSSADEYEDDSSSDHDNQDIDASVNANSEANHTLELGVSSWSRDAGPSNEKDKLKGSAELNNIPQDQSKNLIGDNTGLDKIENMLKGKQFSRDESKRLMEILNSRLVDVSKADVLDHEIPSMENQYDVEKAVLETPRPRLQSNMQDEVAASPIDIARAYMGSRTSKLGFNKYNNISPNETEQQKRNDLFPSKPHFYTPSSNSTTCWPGAMGQDQRGYLTPQIQKGRYGLHNFPRTPYSRTIHSRTKPKLNQLQGDSGSSNISRTAFQQSRTPNTWQLKSNNDVMDGGYGSVGPIRRIRNNFTSEPQSEGSRSFSSAQNTAGTSNTSRTFVPVFQKNAGTAGTLNLEINKKENSFKNDLNSGGPSDETVRKILEQLDRHKPTPKEKADELKLATEWKKPSSENTNLLPKRVTFKDPVKISNKTVKIVGSVDDAGAGSSFGNRNTGAANEKSTFTTTNQREKSQPWSFDNQINGQDHLTKKKPSQPILKPISFKRPDPQQVISSDNGRGFTFPFSATASSASEPPTPSIMPYFPTIVPQSNESTIIPTYSFGTKKSGSQVVFSFPSMNNASIDDGGSDLKFVFGSDKKRVSFGSIGSDAIVF